ncbi:MAG: helix-turn-helix domain-containing protein [Bryobacteraceae bacterium]|jgi:Response regulators consisting of a CheY-like receiver domain and a winged-helix DNA-binding domain|nr:helix-turn-helix domain-containing protein [Bryobacteraceae bacterium]
MAVGTKEACEAVPPREKAELVESVIASPAFAKAPALRKLLLYLWEHRDEPVTEYAIGVDVFGKRQDFDPKIDATVRVHISRLRQKLKEHAEADPQFPYRLVIPPGTHRLEILPVASREARAFAQLRHWLLPTATIALAITTVAIFIENRTLRERLEASEKATSLPELWRAMLRPGRLTRVVYPIPVFYRWNRLRVRDVTNNHPDGWKDSPNLAPLVARFGPPQLSQSYSVASDTSAAIQLTRFLSGRGVPLEVSPTASLSLDQYGNENLIFLGMPPTNAALDQYVNRLNFYLLPGNAQVGNRAPQDGEPSLFTGKADPNNPAIREQYGHVAVLPGHAPDSTLVLLIGLQTASLATFLTSPVSLEEFESQWRDAGRPRFFEAVISAVTEGNQVKRAKAVAFRKIPVSN